MKTVKGTTPRNVSGLQVLANRRCMMKGWTLVFVVALLNPTLASAIMLGQVDDFQDGTTQAWGHSPGAVNVATGGPAGVGDMFLQVTPTRSPIGLGAANTTQWAGDYVTAGVTAIEVDLMNPGTVLLEMRLLFLGGNYGYFTSTQSFSLPADGQWYHARFGLTAADLTWVSQNGADDAAGALRYVSPLVLHHQAGPPSVLGTTGDAADGPLGLDNIRAVPEPATLVFLVVGALRMFRRERR